MDPTAATTIIITVPSLAKTNLRLAQPPHLPEGLAATRQQLEELLVASVVQATTMQALAASSGLVRSRLLVVAPQAQVSSGAQTQGSARRTIRQTTLLAPLSTRIMLSAKGPEARHSRLLPRKRGRPLPQIISRA